MRFSNLEMRNMTENVDTTAVQLNSYIGNNFPIPPFFQEKMNLEVFKSIMQVQRRRERHADGREKHS